MDIGQGDNPIGHSIGRKGQYIRQNTTSADDIVFDISLFSSVFNKDIRLVYIYKKAERLAGALCLIAPAFKDSSALKDKVEQLAVGLTLAAGLPPNDLRRALPRELLALSSLMAVARAGNLLSPANTDLILQEVRALLADIAGYEEAHLTLGEVPTLSALAKQTPRARLPRGGGEQPPRRRQTTALQGHSGRQNEILSFIKEKGPVSLKDISHIVRGVSDKTIQRELQTLIGAGQVAKRGQRRWSTYASLV